MPHPQTAPHALKAGFRATAPERPSRDPLRPLCAHRSLDGRIRLSQRPVQLLRVDRLLDGHLQPGKGGQVRVELRRDLLRLPPGLRAPAKGVKSLGNAQSHEHLRPAGFFVQRPRSRRFSRASGLVKGCPHAILLGPRPGYDSRTPQPVMSSAQRGRDVAAVVFGPLSRQGPDPFLDVRAHHRVEAPVVQHRAAAAVRFPRDSASPGPAVRQPTMTRTRPQLVLQWPAPTPAPALDDKGGRLAARSDLAQHRHQEDPSERARCPDDGGGTAPVPPSIGQCVCDPRLFVGRAG